MCCPGVCAVQECWLTTSVRAVQECVLSKNVNVCTYIATSCMSCATDLLVCVFTRSVCCSGMFTNQECTLPRSVYHT